MNTIEDALLAAQNKAEQLFQLVVDEGLIRPGVLESELTDEIHELASAKFGVKRHWHKRLVRAGPNSVLTYYAEAPVRQLAEDDSVYLDFGPIFDEWEADFGRTYVLGDDPRKHQLVADLEWAFKAGKTKYLNEPDLSTGALYDFVNGLALERGWEFGGPTAGHLIGHFPHERAPGEPKRFSIRSGNEQRLREPDSKGNPRHWILEIHLVDRAKNYGGFYEQLLTVGPV